MQDESFEVKSEFVGAGDESVSVHPRSTRESRIKVVLSSISIILQQLLEDFGSRVLLFSIMCLSLLLANGIGFGYLTVTVFLLILELKTNWRYIWVSYSFLSLMIMGIQIYLIAAPEVENNIKDVASWVGFALTPGKTVSVFLINSLILIISAILGLFLSRKSLVMSDQEYALTRKKFAPLLDKKMEVFENQEGWGRFSTLLRLHEARPTDYEKLEEEFKAVKMRYYYRKVNRFFEKIFHIHGYELNLFLLLLLALYQLTALSIIYVLIASYFSFLSSYFFDNKPHSMKLTVLNFQWRAFYLLFGLDLLRQYFFAIWFPLSWDIDRLYINETFSCDRNFEGVYYGSGTFSTTDDYQACINSWRTWFTLDTVLNSRFFIYFFTFYLIVLFDKYFSPLKTKRSRYEEGDDLDLTSPNNRDFTDHLRFFYYCHFYIIPVILFIITSTTLNVTGQTDIVSLLYFFLGLFLLINYKKLLRERNRLWRKIEIINILVLLVIVVFQSPFIPCPVEIPNRYFVSAEECVTLQETYSPYNRDNLEELQTNNTGLALMNVIGINKVVRIVFGKEMLMIMFFCLALAQKKIWQHPYMKAYVTPYYEKKDRYNHLIAAKYVERVHLDRLTAYRGVMLDKELTVNTERKIETKLKQWEKLFGEFDTRMKREENEGLMEEHKLVQPEEVVDDDYSKKIDKIVKEMPAARILNMNTFLMLIKKYNYNEDIMFEEVDKETHRKKAMILRTLRKIRQINLPQKDPFFQEIGGENMETQAIQGEIPEKPGEEEEPTPAFGEEQTREPKAEPQQEERKEEHKEEEGKDESVESHPLRRSLVTQKSRYLTMEEVFLDMQSPRASPKTSLRGSPRVSVKEDASAKYFYGTDIDIGKKDSQKEMTKTEELKVWLVRQIRNSSLIGDVQAKLLVGDSIFILFLNLLLVNIDKITYFMFFLNYLINPNILSIIFPLSVLVYGAIEYPTPSTRYWRIMMIYSVVLLTAKFLYQSSFFCGTPPYSFRNIFNDDESTCVKYFHEPYTLTTRIDFIIGITKFNGDSSYPRNQGILGGLILDILTFFSIVLVRFTLDSAGIWNHLRIYNSFKYVPQLGNDSSKDHHKDQNREHKTDSSFVEPASMGEFPRGTATHEEPDDKEPFLKGFLKNMFQFNPFTTGEATIRKPGFDYYVYMAPLSLVILLYFIFFYSRVLGKENSIAQELNESLFSAGVVISILIIINIMLLERIFFISRENISKRSLQTDDELEEEQRTYRSNPDLDNKAKEKWILSHNLFWKVVTHYALVIVVHLFFFYAILRSRSSEEANNYMFIVIGYFLCAFYLYLSAQQIKFGYPLVLDNRFFNTTDLVTVTLFRVYRAIPFLYEITAILDWTVSKTSLELNQWMRLEDAYAHLYLAKYTMEDRKTHKTGDTRPKTERFLQGCCMVFGLILAVILPILLFSTLNPTGQLNNVISGTVTIELHAISDTNRFKFTIYQVENLLIQSLTEENAMAVEKINPALEEFSYEQMRLVKIPTYSENEWLISLPSLDTLIALLGDSTVTVYIAATWRFNREVSGPGQGDISQGMNAKVLNLDDKENLLDMLEVGGRMVVNNLVPKFLSVTRLPYTSLPGTADVLDQIPFSHDVDLEYVNNVRGRYWRLISLTDDASDVSILSNGNEVSILVASEKSMASLLNAISSLGIIGFYVTITLAVGRLVRGLFDGVSRKTIYEEMPKPDNLIELCDAIYLSRREGDYYREEKLFNTLVRVFRSPEMMLELTGAYPKDVK